MRASASVTWSIATVLAALAASGCGGPGLDVTTWHPPALPTGAAHTVLVTDAQGKRQSVAAAQDAAVGAMKQSNWFHAKAAPRIDVVISADGARATIDGALLSPDALYLRVDVLEWFAEISQEARDATDDQGNPVTAIVDVTHGHAAIAATLVKGDGAVLLDGLELEGIHDEDGDDEAASLNAAMTDAVSHVVQQMTPQRTVDHVAFDDRDDAERPILTEAEQTANDRGDLSPALAAETTYIATHEALAAPRYNRAVMLEARGDFDQALDGYDDALAHRPDEKLRGMITDARAHCLERRDNAQSLGV